MTGPTLQIYHHPKNTCGTMIGAWNLERYLNSGTPIPILLPYHSHKNPLYGNGLWGFQGGPAIRGPLEKSLFFLLQQKLGES